MTKPSKEKVRDWQKARIRSKQPPPDPKEIRRQLGWDLIEAERKEKEKCGAR